MNNSTLGVAEQIKQLKELLDIGAITQEDYDKKKEELLNSTFSNMNINNEKVSKDKRDDYILNDLYLGEPDYKVQFYKNLDLDFLKKKASQAFTGKVVGFLDLYFTDKGLVMCSPDWSDIGFEKTIITYDELRCKITKTKIMVIYTINIITLFVNQTSISFFFYEDAYLDFSVKLGQKMGSTDASNYILSKKKGKKLIETFNSYGVNIE